MNKSMGNKHNNNNGKRLNYNRLHSRVRKVTDLRCIRNEKRRLFTKMVLLSKHDIESLEDKIPALKVGDHFFESAGTGNYSCFNSEEYDNNLLMTRGFANASLFFLRIISCSESKYLKACYIAPCLYCFRHYVELTLKDTLWHYSRCGYNIDIKELNDEHNLVTLWDKVLPLSGKKDERTRIIGRFLHEISDVDKSGTTFRYSYHFSKDNRIQNVPLNMKIDNKLLYVRMLQVYRFLEGMNDEIVNGYDEMSSDNM